MSQPQRFKRKTYIVDKSFQFKYIRMALILILFVVAVGASATYLVLSYSMQEFGLNHQDISNVVVNTIGFMSVFQLLLAVPLILIFGIILTHRIVGPFGRIANFLERLGKGEIGAKIQLRDNDELKQLVECINDMSEKLGELKEKGKL